MQQEQSYGYIDEGDYQVVLARSNNFNSRYEADYAEAQRISGKQYIELAEIREKYPELAKRMGI